MQAPKEIIQNKYLQHLTTAHWTCSTAAAVDVGHENGNNIYIHSLILQVCSFLKILFNHVHAYSSWSFIFTCMMFKFMLFLFAVCQRKILSMNL